MPKDLAEKAGAALSDPNLISLDEDIATMEALILTELEQLSQGTPTILFEQLTEEFSRLRDTEKAKQIAVVSEDRLVRIGEILEAGMTFESRRDTIVKLQESKAKITRVELQRRHYLQNHVDAVALRVMFQAVLADIRECVRDPDDRRRLGERLVNRAALGARISPAG